MVKETKKNGPALKDPIIKISGTQPRKIMVTKKVVSTSSQIKNVQVSSYFFFENLTECLVQSGQSGSDMQKYMKNLSLHHGNKQNR